MHYIKMMPGTLALVCMLSSNAAVAADWAGFYAGIIMNSATVETDWTTTETRDDDGRIIPAVSDPGASIGSTESGGGFLIGYNWNPGSNWVLSVEASTGPTDHEDFIDRIPGFGDSPPAPGSFVEIKTKTDGMALRLRGGYLLTPDLLLFGTFGKTDLDVQITSVCPADFHICTPADGPRAYRNTGNLNATAIGVGLEHALNSFVLRFQYSATDFGESDFTALPDVANLSFGADAKTEFAATFVQLGVSYDW